jgi:hypothetical protein
MFVLSFAAELSARFVLLPELLQAAKNAISTIIPIFLIHYIFNLAM